jgi:hypothetical protein
MIFLMNEIVSATNSENFYLYLEKKQEHGLSVELVSKVF